MMEKFRKTMLSVAKEGEIKDYKLGDKINLKSDTKVGIYNVVYHEQELFDIRFTDELVSVIDALFLYSEYQLKYLIDFIKLESTWEHKEECNSFRYIK
jgi:hypothetical protein